MKKSIGLVLAVFVFALTAGMVSAATMTTIYGQVSDYDDNPLEDVDVKVTCTHEGVKTVKYVDTNEEGMYYAFFGSTECDINDTVVASTHGAEDNVGKVTDKYCKVGTMKLDLQVPEFGVVAGAVALVGALGIFLYRKNN